MKHTLPLLLLCLASFPASADACICFPPQEIADRVSSANLIFVGTVERVTQSRSWFFDEDTFTAVLTVEKYWKGDESDKQVEVSTRSPYGSCGFHFEVGKRYLVYAQDGWFSMTTHNCGGTAEIERAQRDLEAFKTTLAK